LILQEICSVQQVRRVADNIFVLSFHAPSIVGKILAGQFLNIRVEDATDPLLRRPFSAYRREGENLEIVFNVVGKGTALLSTKRAGELIDVLGPLGVPFGLSTADYETALLVGGGLGVAPLPIATEELREAGKPILTFLGARNAGQLVPHHLEDPQIATDDGSAGFRGNVVELLSSILSHQPVSRPKIFACGPTAMLRALAEFALKHGIPCEVSLEGPMGCGIGICQGCPVELAGEEKKYALMCKDGPVFDVRKIKL
jgi:dihydroorotate dehydrogenase electron transfer subunit